MVGEWCYFKRHFSKQQCERIIEQGLQLPVKKAVMGSDPSLGRTDESYRRSNIRFIKTKDNNFSFLFDEIWKLALVANKDWFNFHITKLDYIQLAEYNAEEKSEYKVHHDVFWINNDPVYHRKLSCVIQLTDETEYEGGDLELYNLAQSSPDKDDMRTQGTAIFFPSFIDHAALPITKGSRYSLAAWFDGPKWR